MATTYNPGATGLYLMPEAWAKSAEKAVHDKTKFINRIREFPKLDNTLHIPKMSRFAALTLSQTAADGSVTYVANTETEATITPTGLYVATMLDANYVAQGGVAKIADFKAECEMTLAEKMDNVGLALVDDLTTNVLGAYAADIDAATWRGALAALAVSARGEAEPGQAPFYAVLHTSQIDDVLGISEFTHAEIRGTGASALVNGLVTKGYGVDVAFSNQVNTTGAGADNPVFLPEAFGVSYNQRISIKVQEFDLETKVIAYVNFGVATVHDGRAVNLRSKKA